MNDGILHIHQHIFSGINKYVNIMCTGSSVTILALTGNNNNTLL